MLLLGWGALLTGLPCRADAEADLGELAPFYRSTQLQGHLIGMGLVEIPDYLQAADIDLRYKKNPRLRSEIPFVDSFSIVRFLGGFNEEALRRLNLADERWGKRSLDYAVKGADGALQFRPEMIRRRLEPYLQAGYRPQDILISLSNVPWDVATIDGGPAKGGIWGRSSPPNLKEWRTVISHFAEDLKQYLGNDAATAVSFKTGVEYDKKVSFDGTDAEFFRFYEATDRALRSVLPNAVLSPGEFTAGGTCPAKLSDRCVYDTKDLLGFANREQLKVGSVPRSLHSLFDRGNPSPRHTARRAEESYAGLPPGIAEIHQFGLLGEPFGLASGGNPGPLQANWEFQVMMQLQERLKPRRVFHWGGLARVGQLQFLNGSGFVRLLLDHYLGYRLYRLDTQDEFGRAGGTVSETLAVGLVGRNGSAVIVSSFSPQPSKGTRTVEVTLPPNMLAHSSSGLRTLRYRESDNVFGLIRADLSADNNLKPEFVSCALCLGAPIRMALDPQRARPMLARNWGRYVEQMKKNLRWRAGGADVAINGRVLRVEMEAGEMLVVDAR